MAILIFRLNGVTEEEAEDVRLILDKANLDYYETSAGRWGVSVAALWLRDESDRDKAKALIDDYQRGRQVWLAAVKQEAIERGEWPNLYQRFKAAPVAFTGVIILAAAIVLVSILPFISF